MPIEVKRVDSFRLCGGIWSRPINPYARHCIPSNAVYAPRSSAIAIMATNRGTSLKSAFDAATEKTNEAFSQWGHAFSGLADAMNTMVSNIASAFQVPESELETPADSELSAGVYAMSKVTQMALYKSVTTHETDIELGDLDLDAMVRLLEREAESFTNRS